MTVGAGPGVLWGDVLSTHYEETGGCDSLLRRLAERVTAGQGRRGARSRPMEHIFPTSIGPIVPGRYLLTTPSSPTVNGNFGPIFTNLLPLGRWGCHSVWVLFLATVGRVETSIIKTPLSLPVVPLRMDPSLIHPSRVT